MSKLNCHADIKLDNLGAYLPQITDRLQSFNGASVSSDRIIDFTFPFGSGRFDMPPGQLLVSVSSETTDGLARLRDLFATAIQIYAKAEDPQVVWRGDLEGETRLAQFREIQVEGIRDLTPHMRRFRFSGENLNRFSDLGGMHVRALLPTPENPEPVWPEMGANGLVHWPNLARKPAVRVYTIRRLDVDGGWFEMDFLRHGTDYPGSGWAESARVGDRIGLLGPVGRPVPKADWHLLGADETGLPAVSRMLETLPAATRGLAIIEVADAAEEQAIDNRTGIEVRWIHRNGVAAGQDPRLVEAIRSVEWPSTGSRFGWFAAEAAQAQNVREFWRIEQGLGRTETLAAAYWRIGSSGLMTG